MLTLTAVEKSYGRHRVLTGLTLTVRAGELYGFVGRNGAGKTTAMRIALGVTRADAGTVTYGGVPMDDAVRARVGYMPEERGLYPKMTVQGQLTFFAELHGLDRRSAVAASDYWITRLGLEDKAGEALETLSLGNQQRVQLAAALVHDPDVLVLDEPFSGLDPVAVDVMSTVLREEADRGVPVVFSSHQLDLVERLCDRIGILADGQIVAEGSVDELAASSGSQLLVRTTATPDVWVADLPSAGAAAGWVERLPDRDGAVRLRLHGDLDPQDVLRAALAHGEVLDFQHWRPSLTDLYRDVVRSGGDHPGRPDDGRSDHPGRPDDRLVLSEEEH
ncbi:ABC transporter ATP-binding protein [Georgenia faecalis]|uniref:ABC transporter ATP-binding protein n=1 Tax=Georgenia faecalis TaxID=2483799 RepID=UPI000FDC7CAE|nr:ATP-binding cassette domain-containing protein [Georgenia faecalis]